MKFFIISGIISLFMIALIIFGTILLSETKDNIKEKVIYIQKPLKPGSFEDALLAFGVADAWKQYYGANIKADCFQTELVNFQYIYSMCKLRKPLK